ncbi:hypothetical protein COOONC_01367 [Cooperia oncophora]
MEAVQREFSVQLMFIMDTHIPRKKKTATGRRRIAPLEYPPGTTRAELDQIPANRKWCLLDVAVCGSEHRLSRAKFRLSRKLEKIVYHSVLYNEGALNTALSRYRWHIKEDPTEDYEALLRGLHSCAESAVLVQGEKAPDAALKGPSLKKCRRNHRDHSILSVSEKVIWNTDLFRHGNGDNAKVLHQPLPVHHTRTGPAIPMRDEAPRILPLERVHDRWHSARQYLSQYASSGWPRTSYDSRNTHDVISPKRKNYRLVEEFVHGYAAQISKLLWPISVPRSPNVPHPNSIDYQRLDSVETTAIVSALVD